MRALTIALLVSIVLVTPAFAGDYFSTWANSDNYVEKVPGMMLRGLSNALVSPFDLLMGPVHEYQDNPGVAAPAVGILRGVQDAFDRIGRAAFDVGGSIFPEFNGFGNYKPCPLTGKEMGSSTAAA